MSETIDNKYRYTLSDNRGSITASPLGENNLKISDQFNEDDDGRAGYERTVEGDLTFIGSDYAWMVQKELSGGRCDEIILTIERKDCYDQWQFLARGYISLSAAKWNLDNCQLTVTADPYAPYICLDDNMDTEVNMFSIVRDRVILSIIEPQITIEKMNCGPEVSSHDGGDSNIPYPCNMDDPLSCVPDPELWALYFDYRASAFVFNLTTCIRQAKYAREKIYYPVGYTPEAGSGWVYLGTVGAPAGYSTWVRPARLTANKKDGKNYTANSFFNTQYKWVVEWNLIMGDPQPDLFTGVDENLVPIITVSAASNATLKNGVLLKDLLPSLIQLYCPGLSAVSNFFNINPQLSPGNRTALFSTPDINITSMGVVQGGNGYQFIINNIILSPGTAINVDDFIFWAGNFHRIYEIVGRSSSSITVNVVTSYTVTTGNFSNIPVSFYLGNGGSKNYVTKRPSLTNNIVLFDRSDVKYPNATKQATVSNISLSKLLDILCNMFQCEWWTGAGILHIEHVSYRKNETGMNISPSTHPTTIGMNQYSYLRDQLPRRETFAFDAQKNKDFVGVPIVYNNGCSSKEKGQQVKGYNVPAITDIQYVIGNEDLSNDGIVVVATAVSDTGNYYMVSEVPILDGVEVPNNVFGWAFLHRDYWGYNRPFKRGILNNRDTLFNSVKPTKLGATLRIPVCCDVWFNPKQKIVTPLGVGTVKQADYNLSDSTLELQLLYDATTDDALIGRPYANDDIMWALSGGVYTYWQIVANDQDPVSGINPDSIQIVDQPAVGVVEVVTYNGVPGFIRWRTTQNYVGDEVFTYTIANMAGVRSEPGFVIINVLANTDPVAIDDYFIILGDAAYSKPSPGVLANDTLPNGGEVMNPGVYNTAHGVIHINFDGSFTYTPTTGYVGPDSFIYTVKDPLNNQDSASIFFTVNPPLKVQVAVTHLPSAPGNNLHKVRFTFTMVGGGPFTKSWNIRFGACNAGSGGTFCNGFPGASNPTLYMEVNGFEGSTAASVDSTFNLSTDGYITRMVVYQLNNITPTQLVKAAGQTFSLEFP